MDESQYDLFGSATSTNSSIVPVSASEWNLTTPFWNSSATSTNSSIVTVSASDWNLTTLFWNNSAASTNSSIVPVSAPDWNLTTLFWNNSAASTNSSIVPVSAPEWNLTTLFWNKTHTDSALVKSQLGSNHHGFRRDAGNVVSRNPFVISVIKEPHINSALVKSLLGSNHHGFRRDAEPHTNSALVKSQLGSNHHGFRRDVGKVVSRNPFVISVIKVSTPSTNSSIVHASVPELNRTTRFLNEPHTNSALVKSQLGSNHHEFRRDVDHPDYGNPLNKNANMDFQESKINSKLESNGVPNAVNYSDDSPNILEVEGNGEPHQHNHSHDNPHDFHPQGEGTRNVSQENATQPGTTSQSTKGENNTSWITAINTRDATEIMVPSSFGLMLIVHGLPSVVIIAFILCIWTFYRIRVQRKEELKKNSEETLLKREQGQRNIDAEGN